MRILHVITSLDIGGAENHLASLALEQKRRGHHVSIACLKGQDALSPRLRAAGIETTNLRLDGWFSPTKAAFLRRLIKEQRPDIVHSHLFPAEVYASLCAVPARRWKHIATKHNDEKFLTTAHYRVLHRLVSATQDSIISPSRYLAAFTHLAGVSKEPHFAVIPYGISRTEVPRASKPTRFRKQMGSRPNDVVFGFVGRFVEQKGVDVLLRGFANLPAQKIPVLLALAGTGPLETRYRRLAVELRIASRVRFLGFLVNPYPFIQAIDVLVLPSRWEGFGRVLLEAMLCRKPIIASRVSSIPEIVEEGVTGLLCTPGSKVDLCKAMTTLARSPTLRGRLGRNGYSRVVRDFSLQRMVDSTLRLYEAVLAQ